MALLLPLAVPLGRALCWLVLLSGLLHVVLSTGLRVTQCFIATAVPCMYLVPRPVDNRPARHTVFSLLPQCPVCLWVHDPTQDPHIKRVW